MLIQTEEDAQPGDPQVPARQHRDGGGRPRLLPTPKPPRLAARRGACSRPAWSKASSSAATSSRSPPPRRSNGTSSSPTCCRSCSTISCSGAPLFAPGTAAGIDISRTKRLGIRGRPGRRRHHRPDQGADRNPRPPGGRAGRRRHRLSRLQGRHALSRHAGRLLGLPVVDGHAEARDRKPDQHYVPEVESVEAV